MQSLLPAQTVSTNIKWAYAAQHNGEMKHLLATDKGEYLTLGTTEQGHLLIHCFTSKGKLKWKKLHHSYLEYHLHGDLTVPCWDQNGNIRFTVNNNSHQRLLLTVSPDGALIAAEEISGLFNRKSALWIHRVLEKDGLLYMIGALRGDLWIGVLDQANTVVADLLYEGQFYEQDYDALFDQKDRLIIALNSGKYGKYGGGYSLVEVVEVDLAQKKTFLRARFEGRTPQITQSEDGTFTIVYDSRTKADEQHIFVKRFDSMFRELSREELLQCPYRSSPFYLDQSDNGELSLSLAISTQLKVIEMNPSGTLAGQSALISSRALNVNSLVRNGKRMAAIYTYMTGLEDPAEPSNMINNQLVVW